jgi:hypothetical protein
MLSHGLACSGGVLSLKKKKSNPNFFFIFGRIGLPCLAMATRQLLQNTPNDGMREPKTQQAMDQDLRAYLDMVLDLDALVLSLQNNGYAHPQSTLRDIIISGMQDAQYSRAAAQALAPLRGFKVIEHLTVAQILRLRQLKQGGVY